MSYLDPDQAVLVVVVWSLLYATVIGPWLSMRRLLAMLPTHGGDIIAGLLLAIESLTAKERADLKGAILGMLGFGGADGGPPGMPPLRPMKWWEFLAFRWGMGKAAENEARAQGALPAQQGAAPSPAPLPNPERRAAFFGAFRR